MRIPMVKRHMRERCDSLLKQTQKMCQTVLGHLLFMKAKHSTSKIKRFVKERWNPFLIMTTWVMRKMVNEADMDFRIPGPPHSVVKHAQSTSGRELIQKIESHPNRHALQRDQRQNQSYNPLSPEPKKMIQDVGNIELCELLETEPQTQCTECVSYWNVGVVCCTCGHFLRKGKGENQQFISHTMDLSVPECVIKKGRPHGHRYGKKPGSRRLNGPIEEEMQKARCPRNPWPIPTEFRSRMIENHRHEELCRRWDALADEEHTHHLTEQEYFHYKNKWWLHSNKQGSNTMPLRHRSDFKQALSTLQRLQQEAREEPQVPIYSCKHKQWQLAQSSSSSWWSWQGSWWIPYPSEI